MIARAGSYYGVQGPWYTVGWLMASTIEKREGRPELIRDLCNPVQLLQDYDHVAAGERLPAWDATLVERLARLRERSLGPSSAGR